MYRIEDLKTAIRQFKQYAKNENLPCGLEDFKSWLNYHTLHYERETLRGNEHLFEETQIMCIH